MRKFIIPGSVRIQGLPGTDENFGVRDNGAGQMWTETKRVGSINYWTGEVVLAREYVPKVRFQDELRILLGLKSAAQPKVSCEFEVSDLNVGTVADPCAPASGIPSSWPRTIAEDNRCHFVVARLSQFQTSWKFPARGAVGKVPGSEKLPVEPTWAVEMVDHSPTQPDALTASQNKRENYWRTFLRETRMG
jgi:hypothetical protein